MSGSAMGSFFPSVTRLGGSDSRAMVRHDGANELQFSQGESHSRSDHTVSRPNNRCGPGPQRESNRSVRKGCRQGHQHLPGCGGQAELIAAEKSARSFKRLPAT